MILSLHPVQGNNILSGLTAYKYKGVIRMVEACILATDLAVYSRVNKNKFQAILDECKKRTDIDCSKLLWMRHRELLRGLLMTACDLAAITKPWEVQYRVADLVATEFFQQGDMERDALNTEPTGMMDRRLINELPSMQVGFIDYICLPLYRTLLNLSATLQPLLDGAMKNRDNWHTLAGHKHIESTGIDEDATVEKADAVVKQAEGVTLEPAGTGIEEGAIVEVPEGETSVAKKPAAATAAAATASSAATASGSLEMKRAVATGDAVTSEPIQAWSSDSMVHTKRLQQDKTSKKTKCTVGQRSRTPLDSI